MPDPSATYVHVPFCSRVCPYCAFTVTDRFDDRLMERFVDGVVREIRTLTRERRLPMQSLYLGGGTPSALREPALNRLLTGLRESLDLTGLNEWTVEVNPEDVRPALISALKEAGVTRVSLGIQSFDPAFLKRLGRNHAPDEARRAVSEVRNAGFSDVSIDLMYGLPGQSVSSWSGDLDEAAALEIPHVSLYELTYEPETPFGRAARRGILVQADDGLAATMFDTARMRLAEAGLEWYEVSNFAVPGRESVHNQVYWRNEPYFGVGPGAFGCIDDVRTTNATDVGEWLERVESSGTGVALREPLSARNTFVETLAAGLRTRQGVDVGKLASRTGFDVTRTHGPYLRDLEARGLAILDRDRLRLTVEGVLLLDSLLLPFLDDGEDAPSPPDR